MRCSRSRPTASHPRSRRHGGRPIHAYAKNGEPNLTKEPQSLLDDNAAGKPESIHLLIGRRPRAAFGNSSGDQQMLEYAKAEPEHG